MRQRRAAGRPRQRRVAKEPLSEGIERTKRAYGFYSGMDDEQLLSFARKFIDDNDITNRFGLRKKDSGLYSVLRKRDLLERLSFSKVRKSWSSMGDRKLVALARRAIEEDGIATRYGLRKADYALYQVLKKRGLMGRIGLRNRNDSKRQWASMGDEHLVMHAKGVIERNRIRNRSGLEKHDAGLYQALMKRGLMELAGLGYARQKATDWSSMSDEELVSDANLFIRERKIARKGELRREDSLLYHALWRRKLLGAVFSDIEQSRESEALREVVKALGEFG